jgi:NADH-quinone oxidoreductase subunit C
MNPESLIEKLNSKFGAAVRAAEGNFNPVAIEVTPEVLVDVCQFLYEDESTYFDQLSCLTGIDMGAEAGTMQVVYSIYSIPYNQHLSVIVQLDRLDPQVPTVSHIWRAADWHEREAFDLLGVQFVNHPDLRRILLPTDWKGYPLRKDYQDMEAYHGLPLKREEE